ncbi:MAG TPA: choice-of-anchor D domain-containing protein [Thermoanaerobaculia bacterium]|jgi:hypothetical protein|nr:choice-of-anchor D domain-containing protein [Thermoanaerobaculia bacterium]
MHDVDIFLDDDEQQRKRGKWLIPLFVGVSATLALGRQKVPTPMPSSHVVAPPPAVVQPMPAVSVKTAATPQAAPGRMAVAPALLDFGDGPSTRSLAPQLATVRNEGKQALAGVSAVIDGPFMATSGCAKELGPGDQCVIAVVFTPRQPSRFTGALKIAAGQERAQIPLRGGIPQPREVVTPTVPARPPAPAPAVAQATPPPAPAPAPPPLQPARMLCFEPASLRFVSTGSQTITLTNPEPVPLRVIDVVPIGRQGQAISGYEVESKKCLRVLDAGQRCTFTVRASMLALQARETMQLTVYYEDPVTGSRRAARFSTACGGR